MATIDLKKDLIVKAVLSDIGSRAGQPRQSNRIGASSAGAECKRSIWYKFRWVTEPKKPEPRMQKLFGRGHRFEPRIEGLLRNAGFEIISIDPSTNYQFEFKAVEGHAVCYTDGVGRGFPYSKEWHNMEYKTHNESSFKALCNHGVKESKPQHYAQCQLGMHWSIKKFGYTDGLKRTIYIAENKNNDDLKEERIKYDEDFCVQLEMSLHNVVFGDSVPAKISENPTAYGCKFCDFKKVCHHSEMPLVNCRTCLFSEPVKNGGWNCAKKSKLLDKAAQLRGCRMHLYRPDIVPKSTFVRISDDRSYTEYLDDDGNTFYNGIRGQKSYPSVELANTPQIMRADDKLQQLRGEFGAICVSRQETTSKKR